MGCRLSITTSLSAAVLPTLRSARFISTPMAFGAKQLDIFRLLAS